MIYFAALPFADSEKQCVLLKPKKLSDNQQLKFLKICGIIALI